LDHVVVTCGNVERSLEWYTNMLGLEPLRVAEFRRGEVPFVSLRISETALIDLVPGKRTGENIDHFSLHVDADLEAIEADERFDVVRGPKTIFGAQGHGPGMYVRDPDGNVIELKTYPG
jgi:catechol 2,3-dioxygenase-like lactoylglutathione lyase family enzyme